MVTGTWKGTSLLDGKTGNRGIWISNKIRNKIIKIVNGNRGGGVLSRQ